MKMKTYQVRCEVFNKKSQQDQTVTHWLQAYDVLDAVEQFKVTYHEEYIFTSCTDCRMMDT